MRRATILSLTLAVAAVAAFTTTSSAALRAPQAAVIGGALQGYLNGLGESINVNTDQQDIQTWTTTVSGNSTFTMMIELGANAPANTIGIYNAGDAVPALYPMLPGAAGAGWFATASFRSSPTRVVMNLFDQDGVPQGSNVFLGADRNNFGVYLQGPGGTFYTQDARNPGALAQALTYAGTGINAGQWWLCFEDMANAGDQDYDDAVLFVESVNPQVTPVSTTTWGTLKTRFR
jgi:hypothetical protein